MKSQHGVLRSTNGSSMSSEFVPGVVLCDLVFNRYLAFFQRVR